MRVALLRLAQILLGFLIVFTIAIPLIGPIPFLWTLVFLLFICAVGIGTA